MFPEIDDRDVPFTSEATDKTPDSGLLPPFLREMTLARRFARHRRAEHDASPSTRATSANSSMDVFAKDRKLEKDAPWP